MRQTALADARVRVVRLSANFGQTAALEAGFHHARGDVFFPLDADGQNDPADIPALLARFDEGYDLVSGWRHNRQDSIIRRLPSEVANGWLARNVGPAIHDTGCTLKAYRREYAQRISLYGYFHRFVPALMAREGARCTEMKVGHGAREHGESKYKIYRTIFNFILDTQLLKVLKGDRVSPIHRVGALGVGAFVAGVLVLLAAAAHILWHRAFDLVAASLTIVGFGLVMSGALAFWLGIACELLLRLYFEQRGQRPWSVGERVNVAPPGQPPGAAHAPQPPQAGA